MCIYIVTDIPIPQKYLDVKIFYTKFNTTKIAQFRVSTNFVFGYTNCVYETQQLSYLN